MIQIRKSNERGYFDHGWLKSWHSFSFADYFDSRFMGFGTLRVINEDIIKPNQGFQTHGHRDMEIITYVTHGTLSHRDSMNNVAHIPTGDFQYMSAGTGVTHSEFNESSSQPTHLYQIWILPDQKGYSPRYSQIHLPKTSKDNQWVCVVSNESGSGLIKIRQNIKLCNALLNQNRPLSYTFKNLQKAYLHVVQSEVLCNGILLNQGDAALIEGESHIELVTPLMTAEVLLFDL